MLKLYDTGLRSQVTIKKSCNLLQQGQHVSNAGSKDIVLCALCQKEWFPRSRESWPWRCATV